MSTAPEQSNRGGRPVGSGMKPPELRKRPRSVTLTPAQSEKLDALAEKAGLSASAWVARAIDAARLR